MRLLILKWLCLLPMGAWLGPAAAVGAESGVEAGLETLRASSPFDPERRSASRFAAPLREEPASRLELVGTIEENGQWVALLVDANIPEDVPRRARAGDKLLGVELLSVEANCASVRSNESVSRKCLFED
jgi:hypothetical protein